MLDVQDIEPVPQAVTEIEAILAGKFVGVVEDLPPEIYHKAPYLSSSHLALFEESPALYKAGVEGEMDEDESKAMRIGTLLDMRLLEPERFARDTILIEGNGNATAVKEAIAKAQIEGKAVFRKREEQEQIEGMAAAIMQKQWARRLLLSGQTQKSYFAMHPVYGFPMKCRTDAVHENLRVIADLKTTTAKVPGLPMKHLESKVKSLAYDIRAVHYLQVVSLALETTFDKFAHVWVSTKAPYPVRITELDAPTMDRAAERLTGIYERYAECYRTNHWPDYPDDIEKLNLFFL